MEEGELLRRVYDVVVDSPIPRTAKWIARNLGQRAGNVLLCLVALERRGDVEFCYPSKWQAMKKEIR